ncbi:MULTISPECIES: pyridoxamine 5'-phosphate oxidase family protein [unclassified Streptomyces]|uniref:pyridoxamine 5'-phosphate oxidase family protein n=1 Tax=unclassified Streptomyces TaxID=2593676 RepID=UPI002481D014|nr:MULTISPECIES: pyridoxamine 5'-phosphate oxidase family protein [unclassified Streptomyces]MDA5285786.1 pyridoxamine 5'-phosphate oxidase family protein [Streptomyces sp. Isolate_45]MDX2395973.1 pyridoxamine 5'-phosphate oxidase family protein [Streptomyces sp. DK15]
MTTNNWSAFEAAEPEFAAAVRARFALFPHHVLATLRKDGSPRVTGLNVDFRGGELWLGMMAGSMKAKDLQRDPRFALHTNPGEGETMPDGDVRISGRAVEIVDPPELHRYAEETESPHPFHLFHADLTEVVHVGVDGDDLVVRSWTPAGGVRTLRRGNDDEPPREDPPGGRPPVS